MSPRSNRRARERALKRDAERSEGLARRAGVGAAAALGGTATVFLTGQGQHYLLALLIAFIAFFAFSQGAVIWVYISEIFPTEVRARGQGLEAISLFRYSISYLTLLFAAVAADAVFRFPLA